MTAAFPGFALKFNAHETTIFENRLDVQIRVMRGFGVEITDTAHRYQLAVG